MFAYITRRFGMMLFIVFGASYLVYNLQALVSNPLAEFKESVADNQDYLIARKIRELNLDVPAPLRYFIWLRGLIAGLWGQLDLGLTVSKSPVAAEIAMAIPTTLRLVFAATILAIVLGVAFGLMTAIRQYSRFDYTMTFFAFLMFSLPVFWVAVLLKEYLAIGFNDFLVTSDVSPPWLIGISLMIALLAAGVIGGSRDRFIAVFFSVAALSAGTLWLMSETAWFSNPGLGIIGVGLLSLGSAFLVTFISTGLQEKKSLLSGLGAFVVVTAGYYPLQLLMPASSSFINVLAVFIVTIVLSTGFSYLLGGDDKRTNMRTAGITAILSTLLILLDRIMQEFSGYANSDAVRGRPVPTISQVNDLLDETQLANFWVVSLDAIMHLILPTLALTLISFAGYLRFSRGSLLEVMNLDFIRTARAKGLPERTVIVRHALRNAMLPLTTILVNDFAGVIGGAIITESVFGWKGMGSLFNGAIRTADMNLFMGVFVLTAFLTVFANLIADLLFGLVDPRIRLRK